MEYISLYFFTCRPINYGSKYLNTLMFHHNRFKVVLEILVFLR